MTFVGLTQSQTKAWHYRRSQNRGPPASQGCKPSPGEQTCSFSKSPSFLESFYHVHPPSLAEDKGRSLMALASPLSTHPHECHQDMLQGIPRGTTSGQHCCPITHIHVLSGQPYTHRPFISSALLILLTTISKSFIRETL